MPTGTDDSKAVAMPGNVVLYIYLARKADVQLLWRAPSHQRRCNLERHAASAQLPGQQCGRVSDGRELTYTPSVNAPFLFPRICFSAVAILCRAGLSNACTAQLSEQLL